MLSVEKIAMVCHEANRAYCASIGDMTQVAWGEAPEWQRESAVAGVHHVQQHPDAKPEDSHNSWLAQKAADGWTYGPVKDAEAKTHPCFVPYNELPPEQQTKDMLFLAVVRALTKGEIPELGIARDALRKLAYLGNGNVLGNSDGNIIAQRALVAMGEQP